MSEQEERDRAEALEREVRQGRKFSPQEALARMVGPGAMKGASPVSQVRQAEIEVAAWLKAHVPDPAGALIKVLHRHLKGSESLLSHPKQPLLALKAFCESVLASDYLLRDVVREADVEWGQAMGERPLFEVGSKAHADDPYTQDSVRKALADIVARLADERASDERASIWL